MRRLRARAPESLGARVEGEHRVHERARSLVARRDRAHDRGRERVARDQRQHRLDLGHHAIDSLAVGLVHDEDVGDLHDAGLERLHLVAQPRHEDHHAHVGGAHDLDLVLADADRLDQDHVLARGREHRDDVIGGRGEAAQVPARGHRADEDAGVGGVRLHPDPVAEDRAAAEGRARVHGDDADALPFGPQQRREPVHERRLARAGRAGDPDHERAARVREERGQQRLRLRGLVLDQADRARHGPRVPRAHALDQAQGLPGGRCH